MKHQHQALAVAVLIVACADGTTPSATGPDRPEAPTPTATGGGDAGHPAGTIVQTSPLSGAPWGVDVSSANVAYITRVFGDALERVNLPDLAFAGTVAVGVQPYSVDFEVGGSAAWVANRDDGAPSSSVGVIDVSAGTHAPASPIPGNVFEVRVHPDGSRIYAASDNGNIYVFNAAPHPQAIATIPVGGIVTNFMAFNPDGERIYTSQFYGGTVKEISTATNSVTRTYVLGGGRLQGIAVAPDGSEFYVADEGSAVGDHAGWVRVVNIESGAHVVVPLDGGAWGLALSPDNAQIYVSLSLGGAGCLKGGCVKVIDRATLTVIDTIQTGGRPRGIAFSRGGETAIIANELGWVDFVR